MKKGIVLLSGGMDSAVTLYMAKKTHECDILIFDYGQKAVKEIDAAQKIAEISKCPYYIMNMSLPWKGSSLLDEEDFIPDAGKAVSGGIPTTYVPARNMLFLSYAASFAEASGAEAVFIGAHQHDYSNYPDCREEFFQAFQYVIDTGTKDGAEGKGAAIVAPVLDMTKKEIVAEGVKLGVPFELTWSCYRGEDEPCGSCESCQFRSKAFEEAGVKDPLIDHGTG